MNQITITAHKDNYFNITYGDNVNAALYWYNNEWNYTNFRDGKKHTFGSDVLPDWTSIIQYLHELN